MTEQFLGCSLVESYGRWNQGNDVIVAQYVFAFLVRAISQETSTKRNVKNCQCYCKNKSEKKFPMVYSLIENRNVVQMFKTLQWNHSPAAHAWFHLSSREIVVVFVKWKFFNTSRWISCPTSTLEIQWIITLLWQYFKNSLMINEGKLM